MLELSRLADLLYHLMCAEVAALELGEFESELRLRLVRQYLLRKEEVLSARGEARLQKDSAVGVSAPVPHVSESVVLPRSGPGRV